MTAKWSRWRYLEARFVTILTIRFKGALVPAWPADRSPTRTGPVEADGAVDAQNAPTAPWKSLLVFHELPQGFPHPITHDKPRKSPESYWETRIDPGKRLYRRVREGFELRGFLRCAVCGGKLTGGVTKGHGYINCVHGHVRARADVLSERFQAWLDSVRPHDVFLQRLDRAIRTELEQQKETLGRRQAEQRSRVRKVKEKLDRLDQMLADGTMNGKAYGRTYPKLEAELQVLEHNDVEDRPEELDVDAMLQFARHLLSQPGRLWADAAPETKIGLQRALFPHGLLVDRALEFSTDPSDYDSMSYLLFSTNQEGLASLSIPSWNRLHGWLQDMDLLRKAASVRDFAQFSRHRRVQQGRFRPILATGGRNRSLLCEVGTAGERELVMLRALPNAPRSCETAPRS